jgi:predicted homoserine dehydrogenase-like protein
MKSTLQPKRVGIVGTGMIARCLVRLISRHYSDLVITTILTRRNLGDLNDFPLHARLTNSTAELLDQSDIIVECSGDVVHATDLVEKAFEAGLPVVTVNAELHVTTGAYLANKGLITEAEGDQPGSLAALHEEAVSMGFRPLAYGNMKGFLNLDPSLEDMTYWSKRQNLSLEQVTSFTDGTKLQIEQALVGNGLGASITKQGLEGLKSTDLNESAKVLGALADRLGQPISDYVIPSGYAAGGVFVVARHDEDQASALEYFKLGPGPYYLIVRPYHLCSLEVGKTIRRVLAGHGVLLNNSTKPRLSVSALAKRAMPVGTVIERGIGGFQVRGEAVKIDESLNHVPIGLLSKAVLRNALEPGQVITFDDVDLQPSRALEIFSKHLDPRVA